MCWWSSPHPASQVTKYIEDVTVAQQRGDQVTLKCINLGIRSLDVAVQTILPGISVYCRQCTELNKHALRLNKSRGGMNERTWNSFVCIGMEREQPCFSKHIDALSLKSITSWDFMFFNFTPLISYFLTFQKRNLS